MCGRDSDLIVTCSLISFSHLPPADHTAHTHCHMSCALCYHSTWLKAKFQDAHSVIFIPQGRLELPTFCSSASVEGFPWFCCGFEAGVFLKKLLNILSLMLTLTWCTSNRYPNGNFSMCVRVGQLPGQDRSFTTVKNKTIQCGIIY